MPTPSPSITPFSSKSSLVEIFSQSRNTKMVDYHIVCSMCGDVGFPDKLFQCSNGCNRFQHSYCSNYYSEASEPIEICDWCKSEEKITKHIGGSSRKSSAQNDGNRSSYSGGRIKHHNREEGSSERRKINPSGNPSPRTATRRYKLLKDVMC